MSQIRKEPPSRTGDFRTRFFTILLWLFGSATSCWAIVFEMPISTVGVAFVPGGVVDGEVPSVYAWTPAGLSIRPDEVFFLGVGETLGLEVKAGFHDFHSEDVTFSTETIFSSTNPDVAAVDSSGTVVAVGFGRAEILVEFRTASQRLTVTVSSASSIQS